DVFLSGGDFQRAQEWGTPLAEELCDVVINHVRSQGYTLQGPVRISFRRDEERRAGDFEIKSRTEKSSSPSAPVQPAHGGLPAAPTRQPARMQPVLDIDGQRYSLNAPSIILGRSSEADIHIDDSGVSRRHLEIRTGAATAHAVDLGSTNGSYVNGHKIVGSSELADGSTITMGRTKIIYRLLPASPGGRP
ncbi:MAG: FhaA domain-containing protein, partial [Arthrobacter sp.]